MSAGWLLLPVYILVDFLDVLSLSGVFEYVLFYGGLSPFYVGEILGGLVTYICKSHLCTPRKLCRGAKNEGARDDLEFQRSPSQILSCMVECIFIPEDKHAITVLENYGLYSGIIIHL